METFANGAAIAANFTTVGLAKLFQLASRVVLGGVQGINRFATVTVAKFASCTPAGVSVALVSFACSFHIVYNTR